MRPSIDRIVCLTEESVEILYDLGLQKKIVGISSFVKRPKSALGRHDVVTSFIKADSQKIIDLRPDLVIGHSDVQKDIARDLIDRGVNVLIANHQSLSGIRQYVHLLSSIVSSPAVGQILIDQMDNQIKLIQTMASGLKKRPKVYFELWDNPMLVGNQWVSECIDIAGGNDIFEAKARNYKSQDRQIELQDILDKNPDIILTCWCGKAYNQESFLRRMDPSIEAVKANQIYDLDPAIFLQPGLAPVKDGLTQLFSIFKNWNDAT